MDKKKETAANDAALNKKDDELYDLLSLITMVQTFSRHWS